ncbi:gp53-like domain-containing protein [Photorhabdus luminescens]|uniref:gp53-like domain-containing protein n=1 Tax=Photorhabdus luminescens TaxID=29488 RepID=UPI00210C5A90|nr:hypothetical protein [Photorhabdus luminescens]
MAKSAVPNSRKINGKALSGDVSLNAGDVGAFPISGGVMNGNLDATGSISGKGVYEYPSIRVYSSINKPSPGELGAYTIAEVDNRINTKGTKNTATKATKGWWKCGDTGVIFQWGMVERKNDKTAVNFPIAYPNKCFNIQLTLGNAYSNSASNIVAYEANNSGFVYIAYSQEVWAYWFAMGY